MADVVARPVVEKVVDSLFDAAKKKIGYMWNCKENVEKLKEEVEKLKVMKRQVQQKIVISKTKGDILIVGVEEWVEEADQEVSKAEVFLEQEANAKKTCFKIGMCGNWATLHHYGKMATKMAPSLLELQEIGSTYKSCVSIEAHAPGPLDVYQNKDLDDLHTHNSALGNIIKSLEDESKQIIGICGIGGVGKTTLAKEVAARVKKTNMFADVAFTTVSQPVNVDKIQKDLENARKRIDRGDKILIILDDVWEKLNLEELCIPCGSNYRNSKILLTSRKLDVCNKMNAQSIIEVDSLLTKEAWILFKRVVGERVETDADLNPVAKAVAKECGGLPLVIQAVGNALKHESINSWKAALSRLKKPAASKRMDEDIEKVFTHLKLSYDYLKSKEAKSCFLLCSLFPEDKSISLEDLVRYGVGLEKFDGLDSIEDARDRVQNAVSILTSSSLLLKDNYEGFTKMHDVIRDVALVIASEGSNNFLVEAGQCLTNWLPRDNSLKDYTGISLMNNTISKLPDYKVNVPCLEIFLLSGNRDLSMISDEFIGTMKNLKVLDISWNNISSLPQSFQYLTELRTLDLRGNKFLHEISIIGVLKNLEILILNETGISEIPKEIAQLENLRGLHVKYCVDLSRVTQGVISALWRLEELCIELKLNFEGASDCIVEVMTLSNLTYLDLTVPNIDDDILAEGRGFNSEKLKGYVIQIGEYRRNMGRKDVFMSRSGRYLVLSTVYLRTPSLKWLKILIERTHPHICLYEIENLNNIMALCDESLHKLEHIRLRKCHNVSCLVDGSTSSCWDAGKTNEKYFMDLKTLRLGDLNNLKVLWKCPDKYTSLTNLLSLYISGCNKLERVFTLRVAKGLINLKYLFIERCEDLKEVIWGGDGGNNESGNIIVFHSLTNISLLDLKRLESFYSGSENCSIKYPSLMDVQIDGCESMETWGPGMHEKPANLKSWFANGHAPGLKKYTLDENRKAEENEYYIHYKYYEYKVYKVEDAVPRWKTKYIEDEIEDDIMDDVGACSIM